MAESQDGPRGDSRLSDEQRNKYANLILLCATHHKLIDDHINTYSIEKLQEIKLVHETWVKDSLSIDVKRLADGELYASYIDEWSYRTDLTRWRTWVSRLLSPDPNMQIKKLVMLGDLRDWLHTRIWSQQFPGIEGSLLNFRLVLNDLLLAFQSHSHEQGKYVFTERFYRINQYNPELYEQLVKQYEAHVDLIHDYALELTSMLTV